jgi:DNA-binding HxlR family transcriptional regulator
MQASAKRGGAGPEAGEAAGPEAGACPIGRASSLLGDRWILLILRDATLGLTRFDAFREHLGIADNILSSRLRRLVESGILVKVPYRDGGRQRHEYRLTEAGADLWLVLRALGDWGERHTQPDGSAGSAGPMRAVHASCGGEVAAGQVCGSCGVPVTRDQEAWLRPWRSPEPVPLAPPL